MLSRLEFLTTKAPSLFYDERHVQYQLVLMVTMLTSCLSIFSALARDNVGKNQLKNNNKYYTHVQVQRLSSHVQCTLLSTCTHVHNYIHVHFPEFVHKILHSKFSDINLQGLHFILINLPNFQPLKIHVHAFKL